MRSAILPHICCGSPRTIDTEFSVVIIGAGLTGLTLAKKLIDSDISVKLFDKSSKPGGQVSYTEVCNGKHTIDTGPYLIPPGSEKLTQLIGELGLKRVPFAKDGVHVKSGPGPPIALKVAPHGEMITTVSGGMHNLITALVQEVRNSLFLNRKVEAITQIDEHWQVLVRRPTRSRIEYFKCNAVVVAMSPKIFLESVMVRPLILCPETRKQLIQSEIEPRKRRTVVVEFKEEFWKNEKFSSMWLLRGPVREIYAQIDRELGFFGLVALYYDQGERLVDDDQAVVEKCEQTIQRCFKNIYIPSISRKIVISDYENKNTLGQEETPTISNTFDVFSKNQVHSQHEKDPDQYRKEKKEMSNARFNDTMSCSGDDWQHEFCNRMVFTSASTSPGYENTMEGAVRSAEEAFNELEHISRIYNSETKKFD